MKRIKKKQKTQWKLDCKLCNYIIIMLLAFFFLLLLLWIISIFMSMFQCFSFWLIHIVLFRLYLGYIQVLLSPHHTMLTLAKGWLGISDLLKFQ